MRALPYLMNILIISLFVKNDSPPRKIPPVFVVHFYRKNKKDLVAIHNLLFEV